MIDLENRPEGATHYSELGNITQFMRNLTCEGYDYWSVEAGRWKCGYNPEFLKRAIPLDKWSIHHNTLPLSELSDEQAAELFNHAQLKLIAVAYHAYDGDRDRKVLKAALDNFRMKEPLSVGEFGIKIYGECINE